MSECRLVGFRNDDTQFLEERPYQGSRSRLAFLYMAPREVPDIGVPRTIRRAVAKEYLVALD